MAANGWFGARRVGSALILCIALLVLLAALGLAFLSQAHVGRLSAGQYRRNTQADLLADGLLQLANQSLSNDLFREGRFHPAQGDLTGYADGPLPDPRGGQAWLASRVPEVNSPALPADESSNRPYWRYLSGPLMGDHFDSPYWPGGAPVGYSTRRWAIPDAVPLPDGGSRPALRFLDPAGGSLTPPVLAADADGDGIADAGLVKMPFGPLDGITYYYAVRIIDNNSALNGSLAWEPNPAVDIGDGLPGDFFPTNLDLRDLTPPAEMAALTRYRSAGAAPSPVAWTDSAAETGDLAAGPRPDFRFGSPYEALWMQLGRRLGNPGIVSPGLRYQPLAVTDAMVLAHRFCLPLTVTYPSMVEQLLPLSTARSGGAASAGPYAPSDAARWFNGNFAFDPAGANSGASARPIRAILTARNPVSNFCPSKFNDRGPWRAGVTYAFADSVRHDNRIYVCVRGHSSAAQNQPGADSRPIVWAAEPWNTAPTRTSVNTADFLQLWLAYWSVMAESAPRDASGGLPPQGLEQDGTGRRMFRSSLRGPVKFSGAQQMLLRAALAAVNTLQLRSGEFDSQTGLGGVLSRSIDLPQASGEPRYRVTVYGADRQPFITEVYARNDGNPQDDYIAVELFNPYSQPLELRHWALAIDSRPFLPTGSAPQMRLSALDSTITGASSWAIAPPMIPAGGYLVLASSDAPPPDAIVPPMARTGSPTAPLRVVPDLLRAFGQELHLLRPRRADGTLSRSLDPNDPLNSFDEGADEAPNLADWVPVDAYDFTNLSPAGLQGASEWHYVRPSDPASGKAWHFVYPGPVAGAASVMPLQPTFAGTRVSPAGSTPDLSSLGKADPTVLEPAVYRDTAVELNNTDFPGPFKATADGVNRFPFGGFARNGDILDVPFIGAYRVSELPTTSSPGPQTFVELNPATVDAAFADDDDPDDDVDCAGMPAEQIGHFCPIDGADLAEGAQADDLGPDASRWRYHWAMRLLDYLTVQCPQQDYLPDVDAAATDATVPPAHRALRYPGSGTNGRWAPQPVANVFAGVANADASNPDEATEETAPVEGLINLNTAPWRVLAAVPWLPPPQTPDRKGRWLADNARIAQAIVAYRDGSFATAGHGPFRSLFELNRVVLPDGRRLREVLGDTARTVFGPREGRLAPYRAVGGSPPAAPSADAPVLGDFISRFLVMTRVSNLVTTRSDSFTVYVVVEGWRDAETASPRLVVQKRLAALVDRCGVTPLNRSVSMVRVPTD